MEGGKGRDRGREAEEGGIFNGTDPDNDFNDQSKLSFNQVGSACSVNRGVHADDTPISDDRYDIK
jgi:hypothetical protein